MSMSRPALFTVALCTILLPAPLMAAENHDHTHGQASTPAAAPAPATPAAPAEIDARYQTQMQLMRELHEKMMAARTPAERQKLMSENMKLMQGGMAMMKDMQSRSGSGMGMMGKEGMDPSNQNGMMDMRKCMDMHNAMMKRMDMMEMMMQLQMDQQSAGSMRK